LCIGDASLPRASPSIAMFHPCGARESDTIVRARRPRLAPLALAPSRGLARFLHAIRAFVSSRVRRL